MPKEPELLDIDVYAHDYPQRMTVLPMDTRRQLHKGQYVQLIFPQQNKRGWALMVGWMDGGMVGQLVEHIGLGLEPGDQIFFQYRHIWCMADTL